MTKISTIYAEAATLNEEEGDSKKALLLLVLLLAIGLWLRLYNLGSLGLVGDEGIQALAVRGILKEGLPLLDSGLIYTRSPLFLYQQAVSAYFFQLDPFWLRVPSVFWGVAGIIPAYVLGKDLFGWKVGLTTAFLLVFSVWEIELSRYARFYTFFQFCFLITLICFYRGFLLDQLRYKTFFLVSALFTVSSHSLGKIIIVLLIIPLFSTQYPGQKKKQLSLWFLGTGAVIWISNQVHKYLASFGDRSFEPVSTGEKQSFTDSISAVFGVPRLDLPSFEFLEIATQQYAASLTVIFVLGIGALLVVAFQTEARRSPLRFVLSMAIIASAIFYQFGLALILLLGYIAQFAEYDRPFAEKILQLSIGYVVVSMAIWTALMAYSGQYSIVQIADFLYGFPNVAGYFLYWFFTGWPLMITVVMIGCLMLFMSYLKNRANPVPLFILGALTFLILSASHFQFYFESRYTFHLYPLIVIVFATVLVTAATRITDRFALTGRRGGFMFVVLAIPVIMVLSNDANPGKAIQVSNRTYTTEKDPVRSVLSWEYYASFHQDFSAAGKFVKDRRDDEDLVIALGAVHMISLHDFYSGGVDYAITPTREPYYYARRSNGITTNRITNSVVISGVEALEQFFHEHTGAVWVLGDYQLLEDGNEFYSASEKEFFRSVVRDPDFLARDGQTFAVAYKRTQEGSAFSQ